MIDGQICEICHEVFSPVWRETICYQCRHAEHEATLKQSIQEGKDDSTWCESEIYCPWCGEALGEAADCELPMLDGEAQEMYCWECGKQLLVTVNISVTYDTQRPDEPC